MSRTKNPYKQRPVLIEFLPVTPNPSRQGFLAMWDQFIAARRNWSMEEQEGNVGSLLVLLLSPTDHREEPVTAAKSHPNRATVTRSPSYVSFNVSVQNKFLLSCRSRRKKPHRKWCIIAHAWALSSRWPCCPGGSVRPGRAEEEGSSWAVGSWIDDRE
jgi:hypothetical protein